VRRLGRLLLVGAGAAIALAVAGPVAPAGAADDAIRFDATRVLATEGDTRVTLHLHRGATVALTEARVAFATEDHDALAGSDYVASQGIIVLGVGQTTATIDIPLIDDRVSEATERFHVVLDDPDHPGRTLDRTWVDVSDNDQWRDPPLAASSNNRGAQATSGAAAAAGSSVTSPAPAQRNVVRRTTGNGEPAAAKRSRSTPFRLYRPAPARPVSSEPPSLPPVASLGLVAAVFLACVSARVWHHWRTAYDPRH